MRDGTERARGKQEHPSHSAFEAIPLGTMHERYLAPRHSSHRTAAALGHNTAGRLESERASSDSPPMAKTRVPPGVDFAGPTNLKQWDFNLKSLILVST